MGTVLRILSANLKNGGADPAAFADLIAEWQPDVVAVQELGFDQAELLGRVLGHGCLEPADDFTGMGIALRLPADLGRLPLVYRDARIARLDPSDWPGLSRSVEVMNVHISSPTARPYWAQPARRRRQLTGLIDYLSRTRERTRAVIGDFNASPAWPVYRRLVERLEDVAVTHAGRQGRRPARTWSRWVGGPALFRIDHCFATGLGVENVRVVRIHGSDHRAVVVDLEPGGISR